MKRNILILLAAVLLPLSCTKTFDSREVALVPGVERENLEIYQVNLKLYGESNAFAKVQERLDEIKELGTDILYLMPVYPEGQEKGKGSPYCVKDYKGVNPAFGSLDDLKALVDAAHSKDMKVMFDWVANHTAWDNPWVKEHPEWYAKDEKGEIVFPTADGAWEDVALLNYENKDLWLAMEDALVYWVTNLSIDGYRCDYAHGVRDEFWKDAIPKLKAVNPDLIMLAESDYERMFDDGFDVIFDRAMKYNVRQLWGGMSPEDFFSWYISDQDKTPAGKDKLFFITNHDDATEAAPAEQFGSSEGGLAAFVLMRALNGSTMLYGSQEAGYGEKINFFNPWEFDWSANAPLHEAYVKALEDLSPLDRSGDMKAYAAGTVVMVQLSNGLVAVNTAGKKVNFKLPDSLAGQNGLPVKTSLEGYGYDIWTW